MARSDVTNFKSVDLSGTLTERIDYERLNMSWLAGERGHPCLNADLASGTEATREPADPNWEVQGASMTSGLSTYNAEGGITITTAGAASDYAILTPHLDTKQSGWAQYTWGNDQETHFETVIKTGAALTTCILFVGLKLTAVYTTATDADQIYFMTTNAAAWSCLDEATGTLVTTDTGVVPVVNTVYRLRIDIDENRVGRMYINDILVRESQVLKDATDLIPYIGVFENGGGGARSLTCYGVKMSRNYA